MPARWWAISEAAFLSALRRVADGEDPELVYTEFYANSDADEIEGQDDA